MIHLSKNSMSALASLLAIANTPASLFAALTGTDAVKRMREETNPTELLAYYNRITARAKRNAVSMAMAYAIIVALLTGRNASFQQVDLDLTRLMWVKICESLPKPATLQRK